MVTRRRASSQCMLTNVMVITGRLYSYRCCSNNGRSRFPSLSHPPCWRPWVLHLPSNEEDKVDGGQAQWAMPWPFPQQEPPQDQRSPPRPPRTPWPATPSGRREGDRRRQQAERAGRDTYAGPALRAQAQGWRPWPWHVACPFSVLFLSIMSLLSVFTLSVCKVCISQF